MDDVLTENGSRASPTAEHVTVAPRRLSRIVRQPSVCINVPILFDSPLL